MDEPELTVLGAVRGESIVIHLGGDRWVIVDSFNDTATGSPAALDYLAERDVDPLKVIAIVLTHPHQDHYLGLDKVVTACAKANLHVPAAISDGMWRQILTSAGKEGVQTRLGIDHLKDAVQIAQSSKRFRQVGAIGEIEESHGSALALAPTSAASNAARAVLEDPNVPVSRRLKKSPNYLSIVLWINFDGERVVLGGDMEKDTEYGWQAVMVEIGNDPRFREAGATKVAHHGSDGAHWPDKYAEWTRNHMAILTPFPSSPPLPDLDVVKKLQGAGHEVWLAGKCHHLPESSGPDGARRVVYTRIEGEWIVDTNRSTGVKLKPVP